MPAKWSDVKRVRGIKLSLTWFDARKCWKKKLAGKVSYFQHPNSEAGYTLALLELAVLTGADVRTKAIENRQNLIGVADTIQAEKLLEEIKDDVPDRSRFHAEIANPCGVSGELS